MSQGLVRTTSRVWSTGTARLRWASTKAHISSPQHYEHTSSPQPASKPPFPPLGGKPFYQHRRHAPQQDSRRPLVRRLKVDADGYEPGVGPQPRRDGPIHRAVNINNLPEGTTLTDLMQAIAAAGPFGMVTHARLMCNSQNREQLGSLVEFARASAADSLVHAARVGKFLLKGAKPFVRKNMTIGYDDEPRHDMSASRVLRVTGMPDVPKFSEEGMRSVLREDAQIARLRERFSDGRARDWIFDSEPAVQRMAEDGSGRKVIEWAFFSNAYQAKPFLLALRRYFGKQLYLDFGIDPCGGFDTSRTTLPSASGVKNGPMHIDAITKSLMQN